MDWTNYIKKDLSNKRDFCDNYTNVTAHLDCLAWQGQRCFLIGGGPSLRNFNFSKLQNEFTIGINKAFLELSPTINYSMDLAYFYYLAFAENYSSEIIEAKKKWRDFKGIKLFLHEYIPHSLKDNLCFINNIREKVISRNLRKGIYGGNNSGLGALMLAIALGANPIYLLGYDMKICRKSHWHNGYPGQDIEKLKIRMVTFRKDFDEIAPIIKKSGIRIVNLNPDSSLTCFERCSFATVLK